MTNATAIVTRFNIFTRAANEAEGLDERDVIRLFEKRKLVGEFELEDVSRYGEEDFNADDFKAWLEAKPRTSVEAMDYLGEDYEEPSEDEEEERDSGSVVPEKYRVRYGAAQNCGDQIAEELTGYVTLPRANSKNPDGGLDRPKLREVASANGIADKLAGWEDRGLNGGLLRMNTANVLRGMERRGERVVIGERVWEAREVEKKPRKRSKKG